MNWRRAPAHTAIRYNLKGLDPQTVESVSRRHRAQLNDDDEDAAAAAKLSRSQGWSALDATSFRMCFSRCWMDKIKL